MNMKICIGIILLTVTFACSRKSGNLAQSNAKLFEMRKSPCFGYCPVYTLTVYQNGQVNLDAKQNFKPNGAFSRQMSNSEFKSFKSQLKSLKLATYQKEYKEPIADASATFITYYADSIFNIMTNFRFPPALANVTDTLERMALNGKLWSFFHDHRITQEYIVQLKDGKSISDFLSRFESYDARMIRRLDANNSYWLISAKSDSDKVADLLNAIKRDEDIKNAQKNSTLEMRK